MQPEPRRASYPAIPQGIRPAPPARTVWPGPDPRDFRDAPTRPGQFYPQHEPSSTPSPRSWQGPPHSMDPARPQGSMLPGPRYGSPANYDSIAPRDAGHLANPMRFQEEAERRPSPRNLNRPLSRGPSVDQGWQEPQLRGSGPAGGLGGYTQGPLGGPGPIMSTGLPRQELKLPSNHSQVPHHVYIVVIFTLTLYPSVPSV